MNEFDLKQRTKHFSLRILKLVTALPKSEVGRTIAGQLVRSGTSVGANYRSACRGRSKLEFLAKLGIVEEEADESAFWMELIIEGGLMRKSLVEANEIVAIVTSSRKTASQNSARKSQIKNQKSQMP